MADMLRLLISLSISASIIALVLFALKPLYRSRLSKTWQYYIWLVVIIRLLLPFAPETNLMSVLFEPAELPATVQTPAPPIEDSVNQDYSVILPPQDYTADIMQAPEISEKTQIKDVGGRPLAEHLWTVWFVVALVLFVRKLTSYHSFARYIKAGQECVADEEVLNVYRRACEQTGIRKQPPIYLNKLAYGPMLVGILKPCIVLPDLELDTDGLELVLRHELIHLKHRDILYKWLVQTAICCHWFNPLMYLVSRDINRNCELSCDEWVIGSLIAEKKQKYGDTLLASVKTGGAYYDSVASVTLSEEGKNLKERLQSILKHHCASVWTKASAVALSVLLLCGASFAGAYAGSKKTVETALNPSLEPVHAASLQPMAEQKTAVPVILKRNEYIHIMTAPRGATVSFPFQATGKQTALLLIQEGEGSISLLVRGPSGDTEVDITASIFQDNSKPTVFSTDEHAVYTVEVKIPEDGPSRVMVYGAGLNETDRSSSIPLPDIAGYAASFGENLAREITGRTLDYTLGNIGKWAEQWPERWGSEWNSFNNNGESWRTLKYLYEDGYLVGVGVRHNSSANWLLETVTINGKSYALSYPPAAAEYKDNAKVQSLIKKLIVELENNSKTQDSPTYTVGSVYYNTDTQALLRELYSDRAFIEFMEVVKHCKGLPVIEELLYKTAEDNEEMYFLYLAEQLPDNFKDAESLARKAAANGNIIILSALERFLPDDLHSSLMQEAMGMDFQFDFDFNFS